MPVMPGYAHADTPHERTVAGAGWRYGCHSSRLGDMPRGRKGVAWAVQDGWTGDGRRNIVHGASDWIEMPCGHNERPRDAACEGCSNRADPTAIEPAPPSLQDDTFADKALASIGISLCTLPDGGISNRAEILVRPEDIRSDESGAHPGESFVLVTITREEVRALLAAMDADVEGVREHCGGRQNAKLSGRHEAQRSDGRA